MYTDAEDAQLDALEARAEQIAEGMGDTDSNSSFEPSSDGVSSSGSEELDPRLAQAAAAAPPPPPAAAAITSNSKPSRKKARKTAINDEEDDKILKTASWHDMEEARRFLTEDHLERLGGLISRWENGNVEEGDDVDLNTGLIVRSTGHLQALAPQADLAIYGESDNHDEDMNGEDEEDEDESDAANFSSNTLDPIFTVCQKRATILDRIIESQRVRWTL